MMTWWTNDDCLFKTALTDLTFLLASVSIKSFADDIFPLVHARISCSRHVSLLVYMRISCKIKKNVNTYTHTHTHTHTHRQDQQCQWISLSGDEPESTFLTDAIFLPPLSFHLSPPDPLPQHFSGLFLPHWGFHTESKPHLILLLWIQEGREHSPRVSSKTRFSSRDVDRQPD